MVESTSTKKINAQILCAFIKPTMLCILSILFALEQPYQFAYPKHNRSGNYYQNPIGTA